MGADSHCTYCGDVISETSGKCMSLECRTRRDGPITFLELPCDDCSAKDAELDSTRNTLHDSFRTIATMQDEITVKDARLVEYLALLNDQAQTIEILRAENERLRKVAEAAKTFVATWNEGFPPGR